MTMLTIVVLLIGMRPLAAGAVEPTFRSDDAQVACRAILPQCFSKEDWHQLCLEDPSVQLAHPNACAAAAGRVTGDGARAPSEAGPSPTP